MMRATDLYFTDVPGWRAPYCYRKLHDAVFLVSMLCRFLFKIALLDVHAGLDAGWCKNGAWCIANK
jgi:hypothetical protein